MRVLLCISCICLSTCAAIRAEPGDRDPRSGLYAIWYGNTPDRFLGQRYIRGGQIVLQWAEVERAEGRYDFSTIDAKLADFDRRGQYTTLQINGNRKPEWLFSQTPYVKEQLSVQTKDRKGTLMYWHPAHREAYLNLLRALASHLKRTDYPRLLGIRMNLNALGTEHHHLPAAFADPGRWIHPPGIDRGKSVRWTRAVDEAYIKSVVDTYIGGFRGSIRIFVRNNISDSILEAYRRDFECGTLSWFHTSSEAEPRAAFAEKKYKRFYDDCRSGKTTAYAEPWASAWGHHGGQTDDRWCSPPQWNYWRLLFDLHCGVSYIALYASDMRVALEGQYHARGVHLDDAGGSYQSEFAAAFRFAGNYAGFHANPTASPGAWVAFRENHTVRAANGIPEKNRRLITFTNDYNFLMQRLPGDDSRGQDVVNIGPENQRFGAWARVLTAGDVIRLALDPRFAASLKDANPTLRVVYLDGERGALEVATGSVRERRTLTDTGRWQEWIVHLPGETLSRAAMEQPLTIRAIEHPVTLHMAEVRRRRE